MSGWWTVRGSIHRSHTLAHVLHLGRNSAVTKAVIAAVCVLRWGCCASCCSLRWRRSRQRGLSVHGWAQEHPTSAPSPKRTSTAQLRPSTPAVAQPNRCLCASSIGSGCPPVWWFGSARCTVFLSALCGPQGPGCACMCTQPAAQPLPHHSRQFDNLSSLCAMY